MKKLFVLASAVALLASCTNEDYFGTEKPQDNVDLTKGIVFGIADGDNTATRGEFNLDVNKAFYTAWNAEVDKIGIAYHGAGKGGAAAGLLWSDIAGAARTTGAIVSANSVAIGGGVAVYKTTRTGKVGYFTSASEADLLNFATPTETDKAEAAFRFFRPVYTVTAGVEGATKAAVAYTKAAGVGSEYEHMAAVVSDFTAQTQLSATKASFANFFMVANPIDGLNKDGYSVGESVDLNFTRPFSALAFSLEGYDEAVYGNLKTIAVTAATSSIASTNATVDIAGKVKDAWVITPGAGAAKTATLTLGTGTAGLDWTDGTFAFMQVLPIAKAAAQDLTITYTFDNGIITQVKKITELKANTFYKITLDLNAEENSYLATNQTLIVNTVFPTVAGGNITVGGTTVAVNIIENVISNKVLTAAELTALKAFVGVTSYTLANTSESLGDNLSNMVSTKTTLASLTLTEATIAPVVAGSDFSALVTINGPKVITVPANAYTKNTFITTANFPKVETIAASAFEGATGITTIGCAETDKLIIGTTDVTVPTKPVKTSALATVGANAFKIAGLTAIDAPELVNVDNKAFGQAALASIAKVKLPKYNFAQVYVKLALIGSALTEIDLSSVPTIDEDNFDMSAAAASLTTVTLKEGVVLGKNAFNGCEKLATVTNLAKIAEIGENAFAGCNALTAITINAAAVGKNAFNGCTKLATVTLNSTVTTINEGAFSGCTALVTMINLNDNVTSIGKEAFKDADAMTTFEFSAATAIGEGAFDGCGALAGFVTTNAATLEAKVFNGVDAIEAFRFLKATSVKNGALIGVKSNVNVAFSKELASIDHRAFPLAAVAGGDGSTVEKAITGTVAINLTLNASQTGVDAVKKTLTFKSTAPAANGGGKYYTLTFASLK